MLRTLFFALGLLSSHLFAQPVFNRSDMPIPGDSTRVMNASASSALTARLNLAGANARWDFSDLQPSESELVSFRTPTETPYFFFVLANAHGVKFADSINLILISLQNVYDFYNGTNARYATIGRGVTVQGFPLPAQYTDPDELYFFPLQFGRKDSSTFAYGINIPNTGGYNSRGGRLTVVDGWGEVVTPFGSYQALRVKSTLRIIDSVSFNGFNFAIPIRTEIEYKWLVKGEKVPVLTIRGNSTFATFNPTAIQYRYNYPRIVPPTTISVEPGDVILYPNPANELVFFALNTLDKIDNFQVFDAYGKMVHEEIGSKGFVDIRAWGAGVYSFRIQGQYGIYDRRLVVIRK